MTTLLPVVADQGHGVGTSRRAAAGVMQSRHEPPDSLDYFPTPPWATRAFIEEVMFPHLGANRTDTVWEPCCGEGHMAEPLREVFPRVRASDVFSYGYGDVIDFLDPALPRRPVPFVDATWIITNPPFNRAVDVVQTALARASGVCVLVRTQWLHCEERYGLFCKRPPSLIAYSVERIPMHRGRWEPRGSTATDYAWVCWTSTPVSRPLVWIPPGQRKLRTHPDDVRRFAKIADAPLLDAS
jgi:hypothetical protein